MIQLYNTLTRTKEPFEPFRPDEVTMYVCGVTVYDSSHIGHAMSALVFDMIRRFLEHRGYRVRHVLNFTDVDDKIITRANRTGEVWSDITARYMADYVAEMDALNVQRADAYPQASQEIPQIIAMIEGLVERGHAYQSAGDVYFAVPSDEDYGKLSGRKLEEQQANERLSDAERQRKEHALDFVLWKGAKPEEPHWDSPWGPGRPGWHIECSAMSLRYLGEQIDIHGGGTDLIFPHHENEIAQTESFTGRVPFVKYWLHNGMLQVPATEGAAGAAEKMSKSLKNFFTVRDFLAQHPADALRLFVLSSHYRRPVTYTPDSFAAAQRALERFHAALQPPHATATQDESALSALADDASTRFHAAMDDDFNTAQALGALFELARAVNGARDAGAGGEIFAQAQATLRALLTVLGFRLDAPAANVATDAAPFIELLVSVRGELRAAKQWALADRVRDGLADLGVTIEDAPGGTVWKA